MKQKYGHGIIYGTNMQDFSPEELRRAAARLPEALAKIVRGAIPEALRWAANKVERINQAREEFRSSDWIDAEPWLWGGKRYGFDVLADCWIRRDDARGEIKAMSLQCSGMWQSVVWVVFERDDKIDTEIDAYPQRVDAVAALDELAGGARLEAMPEKVYREIRSNRARNRAEARLA